jgi:hypothetical protein
MSEGKGCQCNAHCEHECCCDADWTPKEVYDLRAEVARLTAEVAKANAERDEARREICNGVAQRNFPENFDPTRRKHAAKRGWNCFDAPHATDGRVQNGGA